MQRLTDSELEALEAAVKASPGRFVVADGATGREADEVQAIAAGMNALPALLAEVRELRRLTTPEPIGEKHRDGRRWLAAFPDLQGWEGAYWHQGSWWINCYRTPYTPTHAVPLPGRPE